MTQYPWPDLEQWERRHARRTDIYLAIIYALGVGALYLYGWLTS